MGKRPKKPCAKIGCANLVECPNKYCEAHKVYEEKLIRDKNKSYDNDRKDDKVWNFYQSKEWKKFRQYIMSRDNYLCQECLKQSKFTEGNTVHHIIPIRQGEEGWSKRLDENNVITVCESCHNKIHKTNNGY